MLILPAELLATEVRDRSQAVPSRRLKRAVDVALSSAGLLLLLPVFLLVPIIIRLDSDGPVFYAQQRVGLNRRTRRKGAYPHADRRVEDAYGRPFSIYKFRSMVVDAEGKTGPVWASPGDPRVTRVGRFLRRTRLDEVPQLWNVLRGDMSLVGPRPERPVFVKGLAEKIPDYPKRCKELPGITGLAQVMWTYDTSLESVSRKLQYDLYYVNNRGLSLDCRILAATVKVVLRGDGAL